MSFSKPLVLFFSLAVLYSEAVRNGNNYGQGFGVSDYFGSKHVADNRRFRAQMMSNRVDPGRKQQLMQNYMTDQFWADPSGTGPEKKAWRTNFARQGTTMILADRNKIAQRVGQGTQLGYTDSHGHQMYDAQGNFPMVKVKPKFRNNVPNFNFVNDGGPTIRHQPLRVGVNGQNQINHFESLNKQ